MGADTIPPARLDAAALALSLADPALRAWTTRDGKLHREYRFPSFVEAFGFMASAALYIESMNHHPLWSNEYDKVSVSLFTHDCDGISSLDLMLAQKLERLAAGRVLT